MDIGGELIRTEDRTFRSKLDNQYELSTEKADSLVFQSKPAQESKAEKAERNALWDYVVNELALSEEELDEFHTQFWDGDQLDLDFFHFLHGLCPKYITALLSNALQDSGQYPAVCRIRRCKT